MIRKRGVMYNYDSYLKSENSITFEEAAEMFKDMACGIADSEENYDIWVDLCGNIRDYVAYRVNWAIWDNETKREKDAARSITHDALIGTFNMIARVQGKEGIDNSWRQRLGEDRRRIGDYACMCCAIITINMR
jgi:hypothetical protein